MYIYSFLVPVHSIFRWILLVLIIFSIIIGIFRWYKKTGLNPIDKKMARLTMIFMHIQVLTGIILYFISPKVVFSEYTMNTSILRFFALEHVLLMLISATILTLGYLKIKNTSNPLQASKKLILWYSIVFIMILIAIPWPFRNFGTNWI